MKTIYQLYQEILLDPQKSYYSSQEWQKQPSEILSSSGALSFTQSIISTGHKDSDEIMRMLQNLNPKRREHVVSTYLLGLCLYANSTKISQSIDTQLHLLSTRDQKLNRRFLYVWFLICFFHDLGYEYEEERSHISPSKNPTIDKRYAKFQMLPNEFNTGLVRNYKNYRHECMYTLDHGIYGGIVIRGELIRKLNPRPDIKAVLQVISSIIMVHNIFTCDEDKYPSIAKCYKRHHLESLLYHGNRELSRLISLEKNPLLFLFDLVDSIEPMKCFMNADYNVLNHILMAFDRSGLIMNISPNPKFSKYKQKVTEINSWLTNSQEKADGTILITF